MKVNLMRPIVVHSRGQNDGYALAYENSDIALAMVDCSLHDEENRIAAEYLAAAPLMYSALVSALQHAEHLDCDEVTDILRDTIVTVEDITKRRKI